MSNCAMETCSICHMISDCMDISCRIPSSVTDRSWVTRAPMSNLANSVSSNPDSTSPSDPSTRACFSSFLAFTPEPSALFHFATRMLQMEHPSLLAAHRLQFFCCTSGAGHMHSWCLCQHQSQIFWLLRARSVVYQTFSTTDTSEHGTHLNFGPRRPSLWLHRCLHTNLTRDWLS